MAKQVRRHPLSMASTDRDCQGSALLVIRGAMYLAANKRHCKAVFVGSGSLSCLSQVGDVQGSSAAEGARAGSGDTSSYCYLIDHDC